MASRRGWLARMERIAKGIFVIVGFVLAGLTVWYLRSPAVPVGHLDQVGTDRVDPDLAHIEDRSLAMGREASWEKSSSRE